MVTLRVVFNYFV